MSESIVKTFGWIPDYKDIRDYTPENEKVKPLIDKMKRTLIVSPTKVDLSSYCSKIENQGNIGSCTAQAVLGLTEYYENRAFGKYINASRLFLYKTTRNLAKSTGDTGAFLRTTIGALRLFGTPPEEYLPYVTSKYDTEPSAFCYALAGNFKTLTYFRHDANVTDTKKILESIKSYLQIGIPTAFGFSVYSSYTKADYTGLLPYPSINESLTGGHAVVAVGYDDSIVITNPTSKVSTKGALMIRNSWGEAWGIKGYGYLPYDYVLKGLANDFWSIIKQDWVDSEGFTK